MPKSCHLGSVNGSAANPTVLKLLECHIWGDGLAAISWDMQVYVAEGLSSPGAAPKLYKLKTTLSAERPYTAMTVVPAQLATSGRLEVILATTDGSIIVLDKEGSQDQMLQTRLGSSVTKFALSANGLLIACYRRDGYLTVMTSSFTSRVLDFDTKTMSKPVDVVWCGDDAVLLLWRNTGIVMVGPKGDWLNFPYDGPLQLIPEADSCRILTNTSCEILQRLPQAIEVVRRIGSTDPAALLFDAMESFEKGEAKSDENIRSIAASNRLETAVTTCISAGAAEFEVRKQQGFLKAASYGKAFCSNLKPHDFVQTCQWLRILNDIRQPSIGMPMTFVQFKKLTPDALVKRLAIRNHHLLALKVCEILKLRSHFVLTHWASEKVRRMSETNASDEEICSALRRKLEVQKDVVSYLESAEMAISMKRKRLAKMLLELEKDPSEQIPLLLKMKEDETALAKAVASHDDDLTYMVLFHLDGSLLVEKQSFYRLLQPYPDALSLLRVYYQSRVLPSDKTLLNSYLLFNKSYTDAGVVAFNQSKAQLSIDLRIQCLKECVQLFSMGRGDASFLKASTEEQIELIDAQKMLETRAQRDFVGKSLSETLEQLVMLSIEQPHDDSWEREIVKLVKRFRMSEKSLWFTRLHCCARVGAWSSIAKLSNEKKSPIGYKPFASICIK